MLRRAIQLRQHISPSSFSGVVSGFRKMTVKQSNITLYTAQTPNGIKISIALEELSLPYKVHAISFSKNEQKEPWYLDINPNGRIPALTDTFPGDGKQINLFESGSILMYLVDTYDTEHKISYPRGSREYYEVNNWLFFQNAGVGPMQGQANHFFRYAPEKIQYGITRYQNETRRLYGVLEDHLKKTKSDYLVGDRLTIADIAHWGWISSAGWSGLDLHEFPALLAWHQRILKRPAVEKGRNCPGQQTIRYKPEDDENARREAAEASKWVMQGMKTDEKK